MLDKVETGEASDTLKLVEPDPKRGRNLLDGRLVGGLVRSWWFPVVFQWITVFVFGVVMWQLLLGPNYAHDNFGTAMTWVLWWPVIPLIFVLVGRFWCAICPFATVSDWVQKWVGNQRRTPQFLKKYGIWIIDIMFIGITWADHIWGIVHSPRGSGVLMLMITTGVVFSGAMWQRRTWCTHLCFLGGLSGNYARTSALELRATPEKCATCKTQACYKGDEFAPGCPLFEFPKTMDSSADCNLCGYCVKNCPNDSLTLTARIPTKELWFIRKPKLEESFLAVVIMGIVFVQNVSMLTVWGEVLGSVERMITHIQSYYVNFTVAFFILMSIPVGLMALASFLAVNREGLWRNFAMFGYAIIPLDVAGHVAHNLFHLLVEGKAIGNTFMLMVFSKPVPAGTLALVGMNEIFAMQIFLVLLGTVGSVYAAYRIARANFGPERKTWLSFAPFGVLMLVLAAINAWLFSMPMAMRM